MCTVNTEKIPVASSPSYLYSTESYDNQIILLSNNINMCGIIFTFNFISFPSGGNSNMTTFLLRRFNFYCIHTLPLILPCLLFQCWRFVESLIHCTWVEVHFSLKLQKHYWMTKVVFLLGYFTSIKVFIFKWIHSNIKMTLMFVLTTCSSTVFIETI